jgi:ribosomal protein L16 Arg81 hydroxylase
MDFAEFIAPMPPATFMADHYGRRPVQIRGASPRADLLSMQRLEQLLAVRPHWSSDNIKLILNSRAVLAEHFMDTKAGTGARADPAKVRLFLGMGASLVGDHLEEIYPQIRGAAAMLSRQFAGVAGANVYCSFQGIRAFNSHFDLHEVFAVQLEGEKVWQIYENRAEAPVETIQGPDAQAMIDRAKGRVMMTVRMQPGDLLYIPRGYFHDALASSDRSLHLTFGVAPLDGRAVVKLLDELLVRERKVRDYLPDGRADAAPLRAQLAELADEVAALMRSPLFETMLIGRQRALEMRDRTVSLGEGPKLDHYAPTGQRGEVAWSLEGPVLRTSRGDQPLGVLGEAVEWALGQRMFSAQQLGAEFAWLTEEEVQRAIEILTAAGLSAPSQPAL